MRLTENCEIVSRWMAGNKMKLNANKTHIMMLGTNRRLMSQNRQLMVEMDGQLLEESNSKVVSFLGCEIEPDLKWHQQIEGVLRKLKKRLAGLENLRLVF